MHGVFIGASRGIGFLSVLLFVQQDASNTATLLLRKTDEIEGNDKIRPYLSEGRLKLVKGDAMVQADVEKVLEGKVDFVVSTVGGAPTVTTRGFAITVPDVCTRCAEALVRALEKRKEKNEQLPRVIVCSSMGMGDNHAVMPIAWRILYPWLLHGPHEDKLGLEYIIKRSSSNLTTPSPTDKTNVPDTSILSTETAESLPSDFLPEVIILRPAFFSGGEEIPAESPKGVAEDLCTHFTSRGHVARFVVEECLPGKEAWVNRMPVIGK